MFTRGFVSLLGSQFFGAVNDNVLKQVVVFMVIAGGLWEGKLGAGGQGWVLAVFTVPFILLSASAGQVADRWCKRSVTIWVRATEIPIAGLVLIGFGMGSLWIVLLAMLLLSCQSAYFGPAKYGMIPELVPPGSLSRANGMINMLTNIAVIAGTVVAGVVSDRFYPKPPEGSVAGAASDIAVGAAAATGEVGEAAAATLAAPMPWLPGIVMIVIAVAGLLCALPMRPLGARRPGLPISLNPLTPYVGSLRLMAAGPVLAVVITWGFFYLLAGMALLVLPEYHVVLGINRVMASYLLGILGIAIGIGSVTAGLVSGHRIDLRFVPIGAAGLLVFFLLLALDSTSFTRVAVYVGGAGIFAGFYLVPLQSTIQRLAPEGDRGRFIGTANAISFVFLLAGSLLFILVSKIFTKTEHVFFVSCGLLAAALVLLVWRGRPLAMAAMRDVARATDEACARGAASAPVNPEDPVSA